MPKVNGMPKVRFNLFQLHKDEKSEAYINLLFNYKAGRLKVSSGEKVRPEFWDAKSQRATTDKRNPTAHVRINDTLDALAAATIQIYRDFNLGAISLGEFRRELDYRMGWKPRPSQEEQKPALTFFEFVEHEYLPEKQARANATWLGLRTAFHLLKEYAGEKRGGVLHYEDLTHRFFADFKKWLHERKAHGINTAGKVLRRVKQFARASHERRYHNVTEFLTIRTESAKPTKIALTFEELEALYRLDLTDSPRLERVRDLFLIGAYTGLRFSDFSRIRPEHVEETPKGKILNITTQKTGQPVSIPLFDIPETLLRKYDFAAPKMSNQKMNDYLKEVAKLAGMTGKVIVSNTAGGKRSEVVLEKWEMLTTHVARRSFATNFYRDGVQAIVLMQITGHTTERQFMQYIAIEGRANALHFAELRKGETQLKKVS